jgi:hypothetical protein
MEHEDRDEGEPMELTLEERRDIEADLADLAVMRTVFEPRAVKGVVIACQDCGTNHYYEWELLEENLHHTLETGEPRMHEPAYHIVEDEYVAWDYAKGYVDALADSGLEPERLIEVGACPWCGMTLDDAFAFCPRCGRALGALRLYHELVGGGMDERDARALLVRAGYEPF